MTFDTYRLLEAVRKLQKQTGEQYVSLKLEINLHLHSYSDPTEEVKWSCYTPNSNHTKNHSSPEAAMGDTLFAATNEATLIASAEKLENEARLLRSRIVKAGGAK